MEADATQSLDARLDHQQYNADQLITIKVPLTNLAYFNNSPAFERSTGQIEIDGIPYLYVKRRIYQGSLEVVCIPNQGALQFRQSGNNYFNGVTGIEQGSTSASHPRNHKSFQSDPYIGIGQVGAGASRLNSIIRRYERIPGLPSLALSADERPPAGLVA